MEEVKLINIKNRTYYFHNNIIDLKKSDARFLKIDSRTKTLIFTTLDTSQLKK